MSAMLQGAAQVVALDAAREEEWIEIEGRANGRTPDGAVTPRQGIARALGMDEADLADKVPASDLAVLIDVWRDAFARGADAAITALAVAS